VGGECDSVSIFIYLFKYTVKEVVDRNIRMLYVSDMARKIITTSIDTDLIRRLKYLAADTDRPMNELHEEAIKDLLKKYEKKPKK
jgi:hypothetical protein